MNKFDEYRFISDSTMRLSDRRQSNAQIYMAINTAIFGVLISLFNSADIIGIKLLLLSIPLFLVGISVCIIWIRMIENYRVLIDWRFKILRDFEKDEEFKNGFRLYTQEDKKFYNIKPEKKFLGFSKLERLLRYFFCACMCYMRLVFHSSGYLTSSS
jgi:hypothetical protein